MILGGFSVALLPLIHNIYFGNAFYVFTLNAFIPANFQLSPLDYWHALYELQSWMMVKDRLLSLLAGYQFPADAYDIIKWLLIAIFHLGILYVILTHLNYLYQRNRHYFYLAIALLVQHGTYLFWSDFRRYTMFIFALEFLVAIYAYLSKKKPLSLASSDTKANDL